MNELKTACMDADTISLSGKQMPRKGALGLREEVGAGVHCMVCTGWLRAGDRQGWAEREVSYC